jgi:hypothetical protein
MSQVTFETRIGPDGRLNLLVPDDVAHANQDVIVTVSPKLPISDDMAAWFAKVDSFRGSIQDPEFKRPLQDEIEEIN